MDISTRLVLRKKRKLEMALEPGSDWRNGLEEAVWRLAEQYSEHFDTRDCHAFRYLVDLARLGSKIKERD